MSDTDKATARHRSVVEADSLPDPDAHLSTEERAQVLTLLYLLAFIDRANIGNARIAGLLDDLHLSEAQYNWTLAIFFISYSVFEPFTNILLKSFQPSVFIPLTMILWGICMTSMGFVTNWSGLMASRWFLGMAEAGLFPGVNYYLSCWYRRSEFGTRAALFFSASALSGSFGGVLAAGIEQMDGIGNLSGWSWIFIVEGVLTVLVGIASVWMVHDFPDEATFLSPDDRARVIRRLRADQQGSAVREDFKALYFWQAMTDWKMWMTMLIYTGCDMPLFAFSLFMPTIVSGLGWEVTTVFSQLMTVPPYAAAAVFTVMVGYAADHFRQRGMFNIIVGFIGIIGFSLLIITDNSVIQYIGVILGAMGLYPCVCNTIAWIANNTEGVYKRGVVLGFVIGWGNLIGVPGYNLVVTTSTISSYPINLSALMV
ncbi:major facilitator superfamily transporter [Colletotrichum karsti]|uniref:Major facilitator superfamily transporter n=1 Tax=Colletotrichum karsti TaxID=1095194 RepID=A0A9P6LIQ1_9PEZI|nr:major facilitator superfamily transporter [Colletotrichum karsti]KAF9873975.1 major facilitator superfamily transporter [Colletotrichum karsti]